eukprot:gene10178-biopygen21296
MLPHNFVLRLLGFARWFYLCAQFWSPWSRESSILHTEQGNGGSKEGSWNASTAQKIARIRSAGGTRGRNVETTTADALTWNEKNIPPFPIGWVRSGQDVLAGLRAGGPPVNLPHSRGVGGASLPFNPPSLAQGWGICVPAWGQGVKNVWTVQVQYVAYFAWSCIWKHLRHCTIMIPWFLSGCARGTAFFYFLTLTSPAENPFPFFVDRAGHGGPGPARAQ